LNLQKARLTYGIPEGHDPLTAAAIGYAGAPESASDPQFAERDRASRPRKPLSQIVFQGGWGKPLSSD
jgi:hypothetical protein